MIVGLFLRHYKIYENLHFISFMNDSPANLNIFIGQNGSGKSSVLEALDCVFNNREWNVTVGQKKEEANICPVFLIKKSELKSINGINAVSDFFWDFDFQSGFSNDIAKTFQSFRDKLKSQVNRDDYYLIPVGVNYKRDDLYTSTFHKKMFDNIKLKKVSREDLNSIKAEIYSKYSYVYIPAEASMSDILNLQGREFQALMNRNVIDGIAKVLDEPAFQNVGGRKSSIINVINERLDSYLEEINDRVSAGYKFEVKGVRKKTIKSRDVLGTIISEYLNIRPLVKDSKKIKELSSGEQRLALMDIVSSFLESRDTTDRKVILAIDEPENSLHPAVCFRQFQRLFKLSSEYGRQVLITTHWYGLLITPENGCLHYIQNGFERDTKVTSFNLKSLQEYRKSFPNDAVELRSFSDLAASICAIQMHEEYNWLICEGSEDAKYFEAHLKGVVDNLFILPVNGSGNAIKLFKYLRLPYEDDADGTLLKKGKILVLIDTDNGEQHASLNFNNKATGLRLDIKRLQLDKNDNVSLQPIGIGQNYNTVVEDIIDSNIFYKAFQVMLDSGEYRELRRFKDAFDYDHNIKHAHVTRLLRPLIQIKPKTYSLNERLSAVLYSEKFKHAMSNAYVNVLKNEQEEEYVNPQWVSLISKYFNSKKVAGRQ